MTPTNTRRRAVVRVCGARRKVADAGAEAM